jgi:hypothetical protein
VTSPCRLLLALTLVCPSPASAQASPCRVIANTTKIEVVGGFANVRTTGEHAYGYTVMLWRAGECLFGLFESAQGLAGDTPIGVIQDVRYDSKAGTLAFTAKLTTGVVTSRGSPGGQPAHDLFTFEGRLQPPRLTGIITHALQEEVQVRRSADKVTLPRSPDVTELMAGPVTYGEWLDYWRPILQRRGPKW